MRKEKLKKIVLNETKFDGFLSCIFLTNIMMAFKNYLY
jgi:hypothetical protein